MAKNKSMSNMVAPQTGEKAIPEDLDADAIHILEGTTFMVSDPRGDVREGTVGGLFHDDTRFLSRFTLTVGGERPSVLTSGTVDHYSAAFYMTNAELPGIPRHGLSIQRTRFVGEGLYETIAVASHSNEDTSIEVRLSCAADFADLFEVKDKNLMKEGDARSEHDMEHGVLAFTYAHHDFTTATRIHSAEPARIDGDDLVWDVVLPPRGRWSTGVTVSVHADEEILEPTGERFGDSERRASAPLQKWLDEVPRLHASSDLVDHVYAKSIVDLAALRLRSEVEGNDASLPAAGLPWFMAIFGRDTLITSFQSLLVGPDLARGALEALAALQGKEVNEFKDEEPGKILHEIRFGELTALGLKPHRPYYGTADATPLWLILLSEYWRFTGDDATVDRLRSNAERALEWIDRYGDRDADGYVEYATRSAQGLENQGWKDSWDGVQNADGSIPERPFALAEIQGYVYDAKRRVAELAEHVWDDPTLAGRLRQEAEELAERFNRDFWVEDRGGYYVIGLDAGKRRIDSLTSNVGHLLWSGIVPEDRSRTIADQLMSEGLFSGWGVRTLSTDDLGYNPIGYHTGTVWPHDNSIVAAGLARYGFREEANRIALAMFDAAEHTDYRLPEAFAGYPRGDSRFPVRYPTACSPQAWASAAPFLLLRVMLGIEARDGKLTCDPAIPERLGKIRLHGVHAFGEHFDVTGEGTIGDVAITR